ncbi:tripartite tricarboxylate transporter TctB family protein [Promicromonospora alba]|uniref:Tripartite tricarboxylate transporter TctB family protein n=1 Tax=Promicromonospora alba TaxID=1616110 RepID=A0ABV9HPD3_9MICO
MRNETSTPATDTRPSIWAGRSELVMAGLVLALAIYLNVGIVTMTVPEGAEAPGPKFFPMLLVVVLYALAALLTVQHFRSPVDGRPGSAGGTTDTTDPADKVSSNWPTLGTVVAAFALFAVILNPVGWIFSAALLFWLVSRALGSRRTYFDIGLALVFACAIQVAFSAGLGLNLPSGVLEGVL